MTIDSSSMSNTIYTNNFIDNVGSSSQAFCSEASNLWYEPILLTGNYWSDFSTATYSIDGPAGSVDLYPLNSTFETTMPSNSETDPGTVTIFFPYISLMTLLFPAIAILLRRRRNF